MRTDETPDIRRTHARDIGRFGRSSRLARLHVPPDSGKCRVDGFRLLCGAPQLPCARPDARKIGLQPDSSCMEIHTGPNDAQTGRLLKYRPEGRRCELRKKCASAHLAGTWRLGRIPEAAGRLSSTM